MKLKVLAVSLATIIRLSGCDLEITDVSDWP